MLAAMATLIGTAIGAGIFGLPYIASQAGFLPVFALIVVLGIMMLYSNLMYGEIILRTEKECGIVGYAEKYLGERGKKAAAFITFFSLYSGTLAYIILGGVFLDSFLSGYFGGDVFFYATATFIFAAAVTLFDLSILSAIESWMVLALLLVMIAGVAKSLPYVDMQNLMTYDPHKLFLPFGAVLFSLGAFPAVPEMKRIMEKDCQRLKDVICGGTVVYVAFYVIFVAVVLGVTGERTTEESFVGLSRVIGDGVIAMGFLFAMLAIMTSYLVSSMGIKNILRYDYKMEDHKAWFLALFLPYALYFFGFRNFLEVISVAGGISGGLFGIMIILIFYVAKDKGDRKPAYELRILEEISAFMIFIYLMGILYQFTYGY